MAPVIYELPLEDLPAALLQYASEHPKNLVDPKIVAGRTWWRHFEGGAT